MAKSKPRPYLNIDRHKPRRARDPQRVRMPYGRDPEDRITAREPDELVSRDGCSYAPPRTSEW